MADGITLVLGGVGVRGIANIGVLKVLRDHQVPIKKIVTTGINAIIAAHYGLGRDLDELSERFAQFFTENHRYLWGMEQLGGIPKTAVRRAAGSLNYFLRQRLFCSLNVKRVSILPREFVDERLGMVFGDLTTDDLQTPLAVCAIDLERGQEVLLQTGRLVDLVRIGVSFPGLFPPAQIDGKEYLTSVLYCELPLGALVPSDRPIVAIDLPHALNTHRPRSLLEIIARTDEVRSQAIKEQQLEKADVVIRLESVRSFPWGGYRRISPFIARAQEEMEQKIARLETTGVVTPSAD